MECTVSWTGSSHTKSAMGFVAETESGHVIAMDGAPDTAKQKTADKTWRLVQWKPYWQVLVVALPTTWC